MRQLILFVLLFIALATVQSDLAVAQESTRVSLNPDGGSLTGASGSLESPPVLDASGSIIAFESVAPAVEGDTNNSSDVFVRIINPGSNELISASLQGGPGNGPSTSPSMTGDGRLIVFQSLASDLVEGDSNNAADIFLRNRESGTTTRLNQGADGSPANGSSYSAAIDEGGQTVAFCSSASNLVPEDTNGTSDLFTVKLEGLLISRHESPAGSSGCARTALSDDGSAVAVSYTFDTPSAGQVYRHETTGNEPTLISSAGDGDSGGNGGSGIFGLSANEDGSVIVFDSTATDLIDDDANESSDVFLWAADSEGVIRLSEDGEGNEGNSHSGTMGLTISRDGNWVAYSSFADNLMPGDGNFAADIFRLDRATGALTLVSADLGDRSANGPSYSPDISDDGNSVVFTSLAANVAIGDRNKNPDVFLRAGTFPEIAGPGDGPQSTPDGPVSEAPPNDDQAGIPGWATIALIGVGALIALALGWYLLGRKPAA